MATAGALIGLVTDDVDVDDIETTAKTLPDFPAMWHQMIAGRLSLSKDRRTAVGEPHLTGPNGVAVGSQTRPTAPQGSRRPVTPPQAQTRNKAPRIRIPEAKATTIHPHLDPLRPKPQQANHISDPLRPMRRRARVKGPATFRTWPTTSTSTRAAK